jgi:hypothetical protein
MDQCYVGGLFKRDGQFSDEAPTCYLLGFLFFLSASLIRTIGKTPDYNVMSTLIPLNFVYIKVCLISSEKTN